MSSTYEVLQSAQTERLAMNNLPHGKTTPLDKLPTSETTPITLPRFHEESELQALAQNIKAFLPNPHENVIQFIGSQTGEDTSTLIREFGLTVARHSRKPVLLVEADFAAPSHAKAFSLEPKPPLDYALKEGKSLDGVVSPIHQSNMFIATLSPKFFRSLTERNFFHSTDMWKTARRQFSLILIDSSPVNVSPDSLAICETVNGVILVIEAEKTRAAVAKNVKRQILQREGNLLGIVHTKRKFHIPNSVYQFV